MLAHIVLDQAFSHYTNLDIISGKVIVKTQTSANISSIVVKLEGESRTRLLPPPNPNGDRQKAQLEFHKILYKVQIVFPPPEVVHEKQDAIIAGRSTFTLPPGQHEYKFSFKFPFNNDCTATQSTNPTVSLFGGLNVDVVKTPLRHVKKTLPPTLIGFPGEAEIRYYTKVTVNRPNLFKENARAYLPFNFCPIEPPRPPMTDAQVFARRRHQFINPNQAESLQLKSKMRGLFGKEKRVLEPLPPQLPAIAIDIRLPEPAILTCARDLPLRVLILSTNGIKDALSLQSLQIELISITHVRAQEVVREERSSTVIISKSNLGTPIHFADGSNESEIDGQLWRGQILPNTVPPSFETCNISRTYELVARIGVKYEAHGFQPQYTSADLRLAVQIFSGVTPPQALLEAMAAKGHSHTAAGVPTLPARKPVHGLRPSSATQTQPSSSMTMGSAEDVPPPLYSEAPPSYEDALAQNIAPVDGSRRDYAPPIPAEDPLLSRDEKA